MAMQRAVKQLHFGGSEEKTAAAAEIKRLARRDLRTRKALAELGVIPSLVSMLVEPEADSPRCRLAVDALIELADGTFTNKALIVEAGFLPKLQQIIDTQDHSVQEQLVSLLLSISWLNKAQFPLASQGILPFLIKILTAHETGDQVKVKCLETLENLSSTIENINIIVSSGVVHVLLSLSSNRRFSEGALATLGNLVLCSVGKKVIEDESMVPEIFVEIMAWDDKPRCQELVSYILMVLAHGSSKQREKMAAAKIVPLLLEVALLGSPLARKRVMKMLQWFKDERQAKVGVHSGPQSEKFLLCEGSPAAKGGKECQKVVRRMVKQSLDQNMDVITRRANASDGCSRLKSLVVTSSSKSLPY